MAIPTCTLGRTEAEVSTLGLGGEGVLRTQGHERVAHELIRAALATGVTYFESARAYAGSETYLGQALGGDRQRVFLATKSHARRARGARAHLDESLEALHTDWIDLWFAHDVRTPKDLDALTGPGGALGVFDKARSRGDVRFLGVSGHENPHVLLEALQRFDFDCVLLPVNPAEAAFEAFADVVLPEARRRDLGVLAMKTLCRGLVTRVPGAPPPEPFLRYALSTPGVHVLSVGCEDPVQLEANAAVVSEAAPLSDPERDALEQAIFPYARQLAYYRTSR